MLLKITAETTEWVDIPDDATKEEVIKQGEIGIYYAFRNDEHSLHSYNLGVDSVRVEIVGEKE